MASAQAYSDAGLTLLTCFFLGCLLATATHNERLKAAAVTPAPDPQHRVLKPATAQ
jgi:hypothetical protein